MSFNDYLQERFEGIEGTDELRDITRHGLSGGVSSFIYNYELKDLYLEYEEEILEYNEENLGMTFSDCAINCESLSDLAQRAVWTYVELWAHTEYENRMTTLEELNDENVEHLMEVAYAN